MGFIYKIENRINHKLYIGQTVQTLKERKNQHLRDSTKYDYPLYLAMRKYGLDCFEWTIIEEVENSALNEREHYWILFFDSMKKGYNCDEGGSAGIWSEDIKKKIGDALRGKKQKLTEEGLQRKKAAAHNRVWTQEARNKISASRKGKKCSEDHRKALSEKLKGVPKKNKENYSKIWTEEVRKRRSEQYTGKNNPNFGKKHSEEAKAKMCAAARNRRPHIQTEEEKQKRIASLKAYWEKKHQEAEFSDTN